FTLSARYLVLFFLLLPRPPISTLFPYTTLRKVCYGIDIELSFDCGFYCDPLFTACKNPSCLLTEAPDVLGTGHFHRRYAQLSLCRCFSLDHRFSRAVRNAIALCGDRRYFRCYCDV